LQELFIAMRPLSEATARIAGKSFERKYIALGRIVKSWREIAGENLADKIQPVRIVYRKPKPGGKTGSTDGALLEIAASAADATLLHYHKDLILERINQIFGERWVTAIRFVQTAANSPPPSRKKAQKPLTNPEKKHLSDMLRDVADLEIRRRLENLGGAIITTEDRQ
jgi:hypothetical protein